MKVDAFASTLPSAGVTPSRHCFQEIALACRALEGENSGVPRLDKTASAKVFPYVPSFPYFASSPLTPFSLLGESSFVSTVGKRRSLGRRRRRRRRRCSSLPPSHRDGRDESAVEKGEGGRKTKTD